jgi:hypothetical protein
MHSGLLSARNDSNFETEQLENDEAWSTCTGRNGEAFIHFSHVMMHNGESYRSSYRRHDIALIAATVAIAIVPHSLYYDPISC